MSSLTIRIDDDFKNELQAIAKLNNESVSSFIIRTVAEKIENEFDYKEGLIAQKRLNDPNAQYAPIEELYKEYGL